MHILVLVIVVLLLLVKVVAYCMEQYREERESQRCKEEWAKVLEEYARLYPQERG